MTIADAYYSANDKTFCAGCKGRIESALAGEGNFGRGLLFGLGGALLGATVYYGVAAVSGYEIGLIAILVGWLVGRGVQLGSKGPGGRKYQIAAVGITYLAIAGSYVALVVREARSHRPAAAVTAGVATDRDSTIAANQALREKPDSSAAGPPASPTRALLIGLALTLVLPIVAGLSNLPGSALGLMIIAIGLMQAWRMTRKPEIRILGPFQIGSAGPAAGVEPSPP
ncbi:MAG TPA: hypothetical protein VGQ17_04510 [Gemmatimonadales bacterium]|jgi:hypothetical protein|nr:hypothetical protein [Gemmatimonadales bacterium]